LQTEALFLAEPATRARVREAIFLAGGIAGAGRLSTHPMPAIENPFGSARPVEHKKIRAIPVGSRPAPPALGFLDGIQQFALEGHFGLIPVVRAYAAAAVLMRRDGSLAPPLGVEDEHFLVAPLAELEPTQRDALESLGLVLRDCRTGDRRHPLLDVRAAAEEVERRREHLERIAAEKFASAMPDGWLVVDGAITSLAKASSRVIGVVKSHETQFLEGVDLQVAFTLASGHRTSVFERTTQSGTKALTWYLRLWPRDEQDPLYGLVRVERVADEKTVLQEVDELSGWLSAERTPVASADERWDRLLYPIHMVERFLRARAGAWA
jgi:hypothetical protein